ncbi:MAG: glutathione S-transferase [Rhodospirillales bacterium]|nr:glutathione S-transferase [Rhodospirillales bacterium]
MITLRVSGRLFGLPDASPFVTKAEMLLKLAGLPYATEIGDLRAAPRGKLPWLEDDGVVVPDSTLIRFHIERKYAFDFDKGLLAPERGVAWAVEKLLEDHFYWAMLDARWMNDENFAKGPAQFFSGVPEPARASVMEKARALVATNLKGHGMGRYSQNEIAALAKRALGSVTAILGDRPYLMGERPCGADASVFAFVTGALCPLFTTPLVDLAASRQNLVDYRDRLMGQYFPEMLAT